MVYTPQTAKSLDIICGWTFWLARNAHTLFSFKLVSSIQPIPDVFRCTTLQPQGQLTLEQLRNSFHQLDSVTEPNFPFRQTLLPDTFQGASSAAFSRPHHLSLPVPEDLCRSHGFLFDSADSCTVFDRSVNIWNGVLYACAFLWRAACCFLCHLPAI
jgi:hypothetical protein